MDSIINNYDNNWLRCTLICKPEQSGKTFIMIKHMIDDINSKKHKYRIINFILCDNSLLLTKQTSNRVDDSIKKYKLDNETYLEFSSHKRTICNSKDTVFSQIMNNNIDNIISCTNNTRIEDIVTLICQFNNGVLTKEKFKFKIWLDEADKYVNYISGFFEPLISKYKNVYLYCITATPEPIFKEFEYVNVLPIENPVCEKYHGWRDNIRKIIDINFKNLKFIEYVLKNDASTEINPGTIWFIPGLSSKASHHNIKDLCLKFNMAVIIVNGDGIYLTLPNKEYKFYKKDEVFNNIIIKIYRENSLHKYPLALTGYLCIGRGITIMSNDFIIDYAILSNYSNKNEISQIAGRLKGNIKHLPNYKKPVVFTTDRFNKIADSWEQKARKLGRRAYDLERKGEPHIVYYPEFDGLDDNVMTVPIIIKIEDKEYEKITTRNNKKYDEKLIKERIIKLLGEDIFIGYSKDQISEPKDDDKDAKGKTSYEKNIVELTKASKINKKTCIAIKAKNKYKNVYQIWFDKINNLAIVSLYNGENKLK